MFRRGRPWWAFALLLVLTLLVPLEILVELGIDSSKRCSAHTINSTGVCAKPYGGHSDVGVASAALLANQFVWIDRDWEVVLEGSSKIPRSSEVRTRKALRADRRVVAANCVVDVTPCDSGCGLLHVQRQHGGFDTVVADADVAPDTKEVYRRGDVTYDNATSLAFLFWDAGTHELRGQKRKRVRAEGIEMVLNDTDTTRLTEQPKVKPGKIWHVKATKLNARRYNVHCETDGVLSKDVAYAVSLYRTIQMEQPGLRRDGVKGRIQEVAALNGNDTAHALFAMMSADWSESCSRKVDVYTSCGHFNLAFVAPFFTAAAALAALWLTLSCALSWVATHVPHDARSWRQQAHKLVQARESPERRLARSTNGGEDFDFEHSLFDVERFSQPVGLCGPYRGQVDDRRIHDEYDVV